MSKELVPNGKQKAVTPDNIQDYVKRYADYRMISVAKKPLEVLLSITFQTLSVKMRFNFLQKICCLKPFDILSVTWLIIYVFQSLRRGVLDVLPTHTLEGLTAEDFRLLLNGSGNINVQQLMSYTSFSDETGGECCCVELLCCASTFFVALNAVIIVMIVTTASLF